MNSADLLGLMCFSPAVVAVAPPQTAGAVSGKGHLLQRGTVVRSKWWKTVLCASLLLYRNEHTAARADHDTLVL